MMKKPSLILFYLLVVHTITVSAQNNTLIFDGGIITISNTAILTIDNNSADAVVRLSTGHIVSEGENNIIQWNIGNQTGNYLLPFGDDNGDYIPVNFNITSAGIGPGLLRASTYSTPPSNLPWPNGVTHLNNNNTNAANAINTNDRFWVLNTSTFSTPPAVNMSITYRDAEILAPNTIIEAELRSQRFNTNGNLWGDWRPPGQIINTVTNTLSNIVVPASEYYNVWALAGYSNPLPVELLEFKGLCNSGKIHLTWTTASEYNNDYFNIYRCVDGQSYELLTTVMANGNSNNLTSYSFIDNNISQYENLYYKLVQTDINGAPETLKTIVVKKCTERTESTFEIHSISSESILLSAFVADRGKQLIRILDSAGKTVFTKEYALDEGVHNLSIPMLGTEGIYLINVLSATMSFTDKFHFR